MDNVVATVDRKDRVVAYLHDALDRVTGEQWFDNHGEFEHEIDYVYNAVSELTWTGDDDSEYTYTYDDAGRVLTVSNVNTPQVPTVVLTHDYDDADRRISLSATIDSVDDFSNAYEYDARSRMTRITQEGTGVAEKRIDLTYNLVDQFESITRYADLDGTATVVTTNYGYDEVERLTGLSHVADTTMNYTWEYDDDDRITEMTTPDGSSTFTYDNTNQLTEADHSYQDDEEYEYDANGNRTDGNYTVDTNNQLKRDGTYRYEYDPEGNLKKRTKLSNGATTQYTWDHRNRLTRVLDRNAQGTATLSVHFTYDVFDRRIEKKVDDGSPPNVITRYVYDGEDIILTFNKDDELTHRYLHGPVIDQVFADEDVEAEEVLWPLTDHLGTVRDLVDSDGEVQNHITYDSFGKITDETNSAVDHIFGYTGREWDDETDLYYYRARYYDAKTHRFLGEDPLGFGAGDTNLSRYVGNSPTDSTDPTGMVIYSEKDAPTNLRFMDENYWSLIRGQMSGKPSVPIVDFESKPDIKRENAAAHAMLYWRGIKGLTINVYYVTDIKTAQDQFLRDAAKKGPGSINLFFGHGGGMIRFDLAGQLKFDQKNGAQGPDPLFGMGCCYAKDANANIPKENLIPGAPQNKDTILGGQAATYWTPMLEAVNKIIRERLQKGEKIEINIYFGEMGEQPSTLRNGEFVPNAPEYRYCDWTWR